MPCWLWCGSGPGRQDATRNEIRRPLAALRRQQMDSNMNRISLDQANRIIAETFKKGAELKLKPLSAVVLDPGGHVIAFQRQDGGSILRFQIAMGKASGALALGVSSRKIGDMAAERPSFVASLGSIASQGVIPAA